MLHPTLHNVHFLPQVHHLAAGCSQKPDPEWELCWKGPFWVRVRVGVTSRIWVRLGVRVRVRGRLFLIRALIRGIRGSQSGVAESILEDGQERGGGGARERGQGHVTERDGDCTTREVSKGPLQRCRRVHCRGVEGSIAARGVSRRVHCTVRLLMKC